MGKTAFYSGLWWALRDLNPDLTLPLSETSDCFKPLIHSVNWVLLPSLLAIQTCLQGRPPPRVFNLIILQLHPGLRGGCLRRIVLEIIVRGMNVLAFIVPCWLDRTVLFAKDTRSTQANRTIRMVFLACFSKARR